MRSTEAASLPSEWAFRTDPEKVGETEGWFRPELDDSSWQRVPVPSWWETTPVGAYDGVAWYRVRFDLPAELTGRDLRLEFGAVDEEAWVYVNGRYVGEQSVESTGQTVDDIWDKPFSMPANSVRLGRENVLAVRVYDSDKMGGIFRPVRLLAGL